MKPGRHVRPQTPAERRTAEDAKLERGGYVGKRRAPDPLEPPRKGKRGRDEDGGEFSWWASR